MSYAWLVKILWLASAFFDYAEFTYLWQKGDYGVRKIRQFLLSHEGRVFWTQYHILWRSFFGLALFVSPLNNISAVWYILTVIFVADLIYNLYRILSRHFEWPRITPKSLVTIFLCLLLEGGVCMYLHDWTFLFLFIALRFFILGGVITALKLPTRLLKSYVVRRATRKLTRYKDLLVIGIVGSYGKSTVKEFLRLILADKFKVAAVPSKIRTDIAVARYILANDLADAQILIVEMSGARPGYVSALARMTQPQIGILTGVNAQHISYFGSLEKIIKDKYNLFKFVPEKGLAVINADKNFCPKCLTEINCPIYTYGVDDENNPRFLIDDIKHGIDSIAFRAVVDGERVEYQAPVSGEHNALNIAAGCVVGCHLGMTQLEITKAVERLHLPEGVHDKYVLGDTIIIDDSENSNYEGFKSALFVLGSYPSEYHKIVITRGMTELGENSEKIHHNIGEEISFVADELVVISRDFFEVIRDGVGSRFNTTTALIETEKDLLSYLKSVSGGKAVILIENSIPWKIKNYYRSAFKRI